MGVELIIIGIIAGASVLVSGISASVSIGTIFHFKRKFKAVEKLESKDTTDVIIKNEATKDEHTDGSSTTVRKQEIRIIDIDTDIESKLITGTTTATRTGLPNKTAEILANGSTGVLNKLTAEVVPQLNGLVKEDSGAGVGSTLVRGGMKLIKDDSSETVSTESIIGNTGRIQTEKIELEEVSVSPGDSEEISEGYSMESGKGKKEADFASCSKKSEIKTQEGHVTSLVTSVIDRALEGDDEALSISAGQGMLGESTAEVIDL